MATFWHLCLQAKYETDVLPAIHNQVRYLAFSTAIDLNSVPPQLCAHYLQARCNGIQYIQEPAQAHQSVRSICVF